MTVKISKYISLLGNTENNSLKVEDFNNLSQWLSKFFPEEKLTLFSYNNGTDRRKIFLKTGSAKAKLLMYLVLNHYNHQAAFRDPVFPAEART